MSWSELLSNPVFAGGLGLGALGVAGAYGRHLVTMGAKRLASRFYVEAEIRDYEVQRWISRYFQESAEGGRCRRLQVSYREGENGPRPVMAPGIGAHLVRFEGRRILLSHNREQPEAGSPGGPRDVYTLRLLGSRDRLERFIAEVGARAHRGSQYRVLANNLCDWETFSGSVSPRPLESVVLPGDLGSDLLARARKFFAARDVHAAKGIPWTEGWWLRGLPGTGKSSIARALAYELDCPLYVLDLTGKDFRDGQLARLLARIQRRSILLIEELDRALDGSEITLSGLRQALDGPLAGEGRLLIITTNSDQIDQSLRRPGRIDLELDFGAADRDQARRMFLRFFPGHELEAQAFAAHIPDRTLTPAELQRYLMGHHEAAKAARESKALGHHREEEAA